MDVPNMDKKMGEAPVAPASAEQAGSSTAPEQKVEKESSAESGRMVAPVQAPVSSQPVDQSEETDQAVAAPPVEKSEEQKKVESILSDGLADLYTKLPDNRKAEFRQKGEETASQIVVLLQSAKVKVNKVVDLIKGWLTMIPGVNKFFLEQESKIKTDRLLEYKEDREEGRS